MIKLIVIGVTLIMYCTANAASYLDVNVDQQGNTNDGSILNQLSLSSSNNTTKITVLPVQYQIAITEDTFLQTYMFNNARVGDDRKAEDLKKDIIDPEGGLANVFIGYDWQFTDFENMSDDSYGTHALFFANVKNLESLTLNDVKINDFMQFSGGLKLYTRLPIIAKGASVINDTTRQGTFEAGIFGVGNYIGANEYKQVFGNNVKKDFYYAEGYITYFINDNMSFSAATTFANSESQLGKRSIFSLNLNR